MVSRQSVADWLEPRVRVQLDAGLFRKLALCGLGECFVTLYTSPWESPVAGVVPSGYGEDGAVLGALDEGAGGSFAGLHGWDCTVFGASVQ